MSFYRSSRAFLAARSDEECGSSRTFTQVYEAIYREAKKSPLNQSNKMVGWEAISPVLDLDFLREGIGQRVSPESKL